MSNLASDLDNPIVWRRLLYVGPIAIILIALCLAQGLVGVTRFTNPAFALSIAPFDAQANAFLADQTLRSAKLGRQIQAAEALAVRALQRSPLSPASARILGFVLERESKTVGSRLVHHAERLSRRDIATQLWRIENAVGKEDVASALDHFDIAMRTSKEARALLSPVLVNAAADPEYVRPLARVFARQPNWLSDFIIYGLGQGKATPNLAAALASSGISSRLVQFNVPQRVVDQLVVEGRYHEARSFVKAVAPGQIGQSEALVVDPTFKSISPILPFGWAYVVTPDLEAQRSSEGTVVRASSDGLGGTVAGQLLTLQPGSYRMLLDGRISDEGSDGRLGIEVQCAAPGSARLGETAIFRGASSPALVEIRVPAADCSAQWLRITAKPGVSGQAVNAVVRRVTAARLP